MKVQKNYSEEELRYLRLLARQFPTVREAGREIINLQAIQSLPKGCEHFISDVHGEYEAFEHILNSCSGVIRERLDLLFKDSIPRAELDQLATLIYYPEAILKQMHAEGDIPGDWSNYSGDFPLWRMSYDLIRHFRRIFECELDWSFQRLFTMDKDDEVPWFSYQQFSNIVGNLTDKIVAEENLQPVIDEIWRNRQPEDYNRGSNMRKRDFLRSWNHDRNHTHLSIEQIAEAGASIDGDALFELPDPRGEYETQILSEVQIEQFQKTLSDTDVRILQMRMDGCTMQEIAEAVGFKTASAVKKHIDRIAGAYEDFVTDQYGAFLDDHSK